MRDDRAVVRKVLPQRRADVVVLGGEGGHAAGERVIDHRRVVAVGMAHAPHQGIAVGQSGQQRQMLANVDAGNAGRNRLERAANLRRGVRLEIEHIQVRRPAEQIDEDARFPACRFRLYA